LAASLGDDDRATALLFIDLDGFKQVNDVHGHLVGDAVLREVAKRLSGAVREADLVARHGGDEFVVLLRGLQSDEAMSRAEHTVERITSAVGGPIDTGAVRVSVAASVGIAVHPGDGTTPDALIRVADERMYERKRRVSDAA
jgi:diguanylate cyclase (GGDEF)-like protein